MDVNQSSLGPTVPPVADGASGTAAGRVDSHEELFEGPASSAATTAPNDPAVHSGDGTSAAESRETVEQFVSSCAADAMLSPKWHFLLSLSGRRLIDCETVDFIECLERDFGSEVVVELGLKERVGDQLRLSTWLDVEAPLFVAGLEEGPLSFSHDNGY
jgi:hypothetical protein